MSAEVHKPRLAIVSPFLDKRHGTERRVVEWISQLAGTFEIHVYSQRVEDLDLSKITWHRIPKLPGPHLINFVWWLAANRLWRAWDRRVRGIRHDLVFSPGPNCPDADAISVHIVFAEYVRQIQSELTLARHPLWTWPRILHRRLYYALAISLEGRAYARPDVTLILIARRTSEALARFYGRSERFPVVWVGLDHTLFNPTRRSSLRENARQALEISSERFTLLLIGNDWRNKGLPVLLQALADLRGLPIDLLVVGREDPQSYAAIVNEHALEDRVHFLPPRADVEFYYSAADAYVGASLEDTFAQPPAEAMACGLPVIVSQTNGTAEIITDGVDGLILEDPTDSSALAAMIRRLYEEKEFRSTLAEKAAGTARQYTWERNGRELTAIFEEILQRKKGETGAPARSEIMNATVPQNKP
ncbi:MAG: glycosyltransferase family 4 protein [Candidatus Acidiferrales bacterium]